MCSLQTEDQVVIRASLSEDDEMHDGSGEEVDGVASRHEAVRV